MPKVRLRNLNPSHAKTEPGRGCVESHWSGSLCPRAGDSRGGLCRKRRSGRVRFYQLRKDYFHHPSARQHMEALRDFGRLLTWRDPEPLTPVHQCLVVVSIQPSLVRSQSFSLSVTPAPSSPACVTQGNTARSGAWLDRSERSRRGRGRRRASPCSAAPRRASARAVDRDPGVLAAARPVGMLDRVGDVASREPDEVAPAAPMMPARKPLWAVFDHLDTSSPPHWAARSGSAGRLPAVSDRSGEAHNDTTFLPVVAQRRPALRPRARTVVACTTRAGGGQVSKPGGETAENRCRTHVDLLNPRPLRRQCLTGAPAGGAPRSTRQGRCPLRRPAGPGARRSRGSSPRPRRR